MIKIYNAETIRGISSVEVKIGYDPETGEFICYNCALHVTKRCNLLCKLCAQKCFLYRTPDHPSLEDLKRYATGYFNLADYTYKFDLTGGEPLLRDDLPELLDYLYGFRKQFGRLRFNTNGTVIPNEKLIGVLHRYGNGAEFLIDHYRASTHVEELVDVCEKNNIPYVVRDYHSETPYMDGWADFGDFQEKREADYSCFTRGKYTDVVGGKLHLCDRQVVYANFGYPKGNDANGEYVDLLNGSDKEEKREKLMHLWKLPALTACEYCNGRGKNSARYLPGEQLTPEELKTIRKI